MGSPSAGKMHDGRDGMEEEEELTPKFGEEFPRHLEPMSVEALEFYIVEIEKEIMRVKIEIKERKSLQSGAEALFRK